MPTSPPSVRNRKPQQVAFIVALIAIPALFLWMYLTPGQKGEETFDSLQSKTVEKTPLQQMEEMWEHHPGHGPVALELANLYLADGQYAKAVEFYNKFLETDTSATGWEVRLDISRAYSAMGKTKEAVAELNRILERRPDHPGALYNLGAIQANSGNFSAARTAWETLIAKHPQDTLAHFAQASLPKLNKPDGHP